MVSFKIYGITTGQQIIATHILSNISRRQLGNEIWSVNIINHEKYFCSKTMQKMS